MVALAINSNKLNELERLKSLLPDKLDCLVIITEAKKVKPALIKTQKTAQNRCVIQIDLIRWQELNFDQRNLLFWYEVTLIQNQAIAPTNWEWLVLSIGLGSSLLEIVDQNVILLSAYLLVTGLVAYQLYQHHWGEKSFKKLTKTDQGAIALATEFGYPLPKAYLSLQSALKTLIQHTPEKLTQARYATRLQVLQICNSTAWISTH
jgi:hypothetical protein